MEAELIRNTLQSSYLGALRGAPRIFCLSPNKRRKNISPVTGLLEVDSANSLLPPVVRNLPVNNGWVRFTLQKPEVAVNSPLVRCDFSDSAIRAIEFSPSQRSPAEWGLTIGLLCAAAALQALAGSDSAQTKPSSASKDDGLKTLFEPSWHGKAELRWPLFTLSAADSTWIRTLGNAASKRSTKENEHLRFLNKSTHWLRIPQIRHSDRPAKLSLTLPETPALLFRFKHETKDISPKALLKLAQKYELRAAMLGLAGEGQKWTRVLHPKLVVLPDIYDNERSRHSRYGPEGKGTERVKLLKHVGRFLSRHSKRQSDVGPPPPYLQLVAGPFFGKSYFAMQLALKAELFGCRPVFHCFRRSASDDLSDPKLALQTLYRQLIDYHGITGFPQQVLGSDGFVKLLRTVSKQLAAGQTQLIIIDGLDEVFGPLGSNGIGQLVQLLPDPGALLHIPGIAYFLTTRPEVQLSWQRDPRVCETIPIPVERVEFEDLFVPEVEATLRRMSLGVPEPLIRPFAKRSGGYLGLCLEFFVGPRGKPHWNDWQLNPESIPNGLSGVLADLWTAILDRKPGGRNEPVDTWATIQMRTAMLLPALTATPLTLEEMAALCGAMTEVGPRPHGIADPADFTSAHLDQLWHHAGDLFLSDSKMERRWQFFHTAVADFLRGRLPNSPRSLPSRQEEQWWGEALARACMIVAHQQNNPAREYALRNGVRHLLEAGLLKEAVKWLQESALLETCNKVFAVTPEMLALQHLSRTLAVAVEAQDVPAAAWLALEHARRTEQVRRLTPIQAWLKTHNWEYAGGVSEFDSNTDLALCYKLWLIRELERSGRANEAECARQKLGSEAETEVGRGFDGLKNALQEGQGSESDIRETKSAEVHTDKILSLSDITTVLEEASKIDDPFARARFLNEQYPNLPQEFKRPYPGDPITGMEEVDTLMAWHRANHQIHVSTALELASKDTDEIRGLDKALEAALEIPITLTGTTPLRSLYSALARAQDPDAARRLDRAMGAARVAPSECAHASSLCALYHMLDQKRKPDGAELLDEAIEVVIGIRHEWTRAHQLSDLCNVLAQAQDQGAGKRLDKAIRLAHDIEDESDRAKVLNALIPVLDGARDSDAAMRLSKALELARELLDESTDKYTLVCLYPELTRARDLYGIKVVDKALDEVREIRNECARAQALRNLYPSLGVARDSNGGKLLDKALETVLEIQDKQTRTALLCALYPRFAKAEDPSSHKRMEKVIEMSREIEDEQNRAYALVSLCPALAQVQNPDPDKLLGKAEEVALEIQDEEARSAALTALYIAMAQAQDPDCSKRQDKALKAALEIQDDQARASFLYTLYPILTQAKDPRSGKRLDKVLKAIKEIKDERTRAGALITLYPFLAKAQNAEVCKRLGQALGVALEIQETEARADALMLLYPSLATARGPFDTKFVDKALRVALNFQDEETRVDALCALSHLLTLSRDPFAGRRLGKALDAARKIQDEGTRAKALRAVFPALAQAQDQFAGRRLNEAHEVVLEIQNQDTRAEALIALYLELAQTKGAGAGMLLDKSIRAALEIQHEEARDRILKVLCPVLAQAQDPNALNRWVELIETLREMRPSSELASSIINQCIELAPNAALASSVASLEFAKWHLPATRSALIALAKIAPENAGGIVNWLFQARNEPPW